VDLVGLSCLFRTNTTESSAHASLLRNVCFRFGSSTGATPSAVTALSLTDEEDVPEELERRVLCLTSTGVAPAKMSLRVESSGMVSGATVEAEKVAWLEGRRVR